MTVRRCKGGTAGSPLAAWLRENAQRQESLRNSRSEMANGVVSRSPGRARALIQTAVLNLRPMLLFPGRCLGYYKPPRWGSPRTSGYAGKNAVTLLRHNTPDTLRPIMGEASSGS